MLLYIVTSKWVPFSKGGSWYSGILGYLQTKTHCLVGGLEPFFLYFYILGRIIPTDFHIFQRCGSTTNQLLFVFASLVGPFFQQPCWWWSLWWWFAHHSGLPVIICQSYLVMIWSWFGHSQAYSHDCPPPEFNEVVDYTMPTSETSEA